MKKINDGNEISILLLVNISIETRVLFSICGRCILCLEFTFVCIQMSNRIHMDYTKLVRINGSHICETDVCQCTNTSEQKNSALNIIRYCQWNIRKGFNYKKQALSLKSVEYGNCFGQYTTKRFTSSPQKPIIIMLDRNCPWKQSYLLLKIYKIIIYC